MTSYQTVAQIAANADPSTARALHLTSRLRGRLDALEAAIAGQDVRARLRVSVELGGLVEELLDITYRGAPTR
jgi:hypothetical protein